MTKDDRMIEGCDGPHVPAWLFLMDKTASGWWQSEKRPIQYIYIYVCVCSYIIDFIPMSTVQELQSIGPTALEGDAILMIWPICPS